MINDLREKPVRTQSSDETYRHEFYPETESYLPAEPGSAMGVAEIELTHALPETPPDFAAKRPLSEFRTSMEVGSNPTGKIVGVVVIAAALAAAGIYSFESGMWNSSPVPASHLPAPAPLPPVLPVAPPQPSMVAPPAPPAPIETAPKPAPAHHARAPVVSPSPTANVAPSPDAAPPDIPATQNSAPAVTPSVTPTVTPSVTPDVPPPQTAPDQPAPAAQDQSSPAQQ